ncbi:N-acetylmuramoyl-L-alanine amidase family protein [Paenibacillus sp. S150]|uniref:N-acetylmuramoyl-L-alanine amidase family protein n=1 Tax=Paenibacillus sp. S150 TaxID=2749826 RepID=UPI001C590F34|nr:N-acetylmuramoyl-L-alanine amidase family protein [Paenibacillus sp. S150]MBW4085606.1 N-acetylmuramoyl-L-alanine amidase [Paenibacillus sp. S150]
MRRAGQRVLFLLLLPLLLLSFAGHEAAAAGNSTGRIVMDNKELELPRGINLENVNGSVMIPIRVVVENLGFEVLWEQESRKVTVQQDGKSVQLAVGSKTAEADGVTLALNAAPKQNGGTVLVPIRFISEQFGLKVGWDNTDKTVYLSGGVNDVAAGSSAPWPAEDPASAAIPAPTHVPADSQGTDEDIVTGAGEPTPTPIPGSAGTVAASPQVMGAVFSENRLIIAVAGAAKPTVTKIGSPERIIIDFPGASFASGFAGSFPGVSASGSPQGKLDVSGYPLISEVRYALFSVNPPTVRFVIQTVASQPYEVSTEDSTGLVTVDLNVEGNGTPFPGGTGFSGRPLVALDAGHGGTQSGAVSLTGRLEKNFNLAVIQKVGTLLLQEGVADVVFTRTEDSTLGLQERVAIAEAGQANLFISLHANSLPVEYPNRDKVNGSESYYSRTESLPLAQIMHKHLVAGTGFKDNGIRSKSLHVTRETSMPAVLLEAGYLTNPGNESAMYSERLQDSLAREIVAGIKEYLGL